MEKFNIELKKGKLLSVLQKKRAIQELNEISNYILNDYAFLSLRYEGIIEFSPVKYEKTPPWHDLENTWNLFINSFIDIQYLIIFYEFTSDIKYFKKATELISSWISYDKTLKSKQNKFVWCDQAIAYRTIAFINYLVLSEEVDKSFRNEKLNKTINNYLIKQGEWLFDDKNYTRGNHGFMIDKALLYLSIYSKNEKQAQLYQNKSITRLVEGIKLDFSDEGVHLENSISYHITMIKWYNLLNDFLSQYIDTSKIEYLDIPTKKATDFLYRIIMPNCEFPLVGDSALIENFGVDFGNEKLKYVLSHTEKGTPVEAGLAFYKDAGMAIYRSSFSKDYKNDLWWFMKSGAKSFVHKHDDDLSFLIYSNGNQIFTDAGHYSYNFKDAFRQYILSPSAHNTISIKNEAYHGNINYEDMIDMLEVVEENDKYIVCTAENRAYGNTHIKRHLIYIKPDIFVVVDQTKTINEKNTYSQNFMFGSNMKISKYDNSTCKAVSKDGNTSVQIVQHLDIDKAITHDENNLNKGYISNVAGKKVEIDFISFEKTGQDVTYITSFALNGDVEISCEKVNDEVKIIVGGETYNIQLKDFKHDIAREDLEKTLCIKGQKVETVKDKYKFAIEVYNKNVRYAFQLYYNNELVEQKNFSNENFYMFKPQNEGVYAVRYIVEKTTDKRMDRTPFDTVYDYFTKRIVVDSNGLLDDNFLYKSEAITSIENGYRFTINYLNQDLLYAFYLYKDGELLERFDYTQNNYLDLVGLQKGEYRIKYFVKKANNDEDKDCRFALENIVVN